MSAAATCLALPSDTPTRRRQGRRHVHGYAREWLESQTAAALVQRVFHLGDAALLDDGRYDAACECVHDKALPVGTLEATQRAIVPAGPIVSMDEAVGDVRLQRLRFSVFT